MRSVRIKQLQEFLKSDHWLRRCCILSGGVFCFEPPCRWKHTEQSRSSCRQSS